MGYKKHTEKQADLIVKQLTRRTAVD